MDQKMRARALGICQRRTNINEQPAVVAADGIKTLSVPLVVSIRLSSPPSVTNVIDSQAVNDHSIFYNYAYHLLP